MSISVVIPAFNEEVSIGRCLDNLVEQIDDIAEIVVVNNNSTDKTADIVAAHQATVQNIRLLDESRQGIVPARNRGLASATSDVIARIDADTIVQPGWAAAIDTFFSSAGPEFGAAVGPFTQYDMPLQGVHRALMRIATTSRKGESDEVKQSPGVYGANMAIRRDVWEQIESLTHDEPGIWEDLDISIALRAVGRKIAVIEGMRVQVSGRRMLTSRKLYWQFTRGVPRTWELHGDRSRARASWINVWIARAMYLAFWVPTRTYDPMTRKHSIRRLFARREDRPIA
ncbi:glycosyltransferase [Williamsia muralis]|uniref:glycosyltransferase n=1 Tax=Williamsia marianensis TaxID=85044 RepID=UPI0038149DC6